MKKISINNIKQLKKIDFIGVVHVIPTKLLEVLETIQLPIEKEKAIMQICNFLSYLNFIQHKNNTSIIVIPHKIFEKYFSHTTYNQYKQILKDNNILTQISYDNGIGYDMNKGIAKQYRIHNEYLNNNDFTILIFDKKKNKKIITLETNVPINYLNTICKEELDYYNVFTQEHNYHIENQTTNFSLYSRITRALFLSIKRYIKKGNKVDRIYHSFSNISRVSRECFYTKFNNVDLKNSQPMLLVFYLKNNNIEFEIEYQNVCEDSRFYELFYDLYSKQYNNPELLRAAVKQEVYRSLFFGFDKRSEVNKRFKTLFPKIWNALNDIKNNDIELASILQNIEADIFNNLDIKYSKKYYTLFDAIYFNDKRDIPRIEKQLNSYGKKMGIKLKLEVKVK